jgi:hypothetical protein
MVTGGPGGTGNDERCWRAQVLPFPAQGGTGKEGPLVGCMSLPGLSDLFKSQSG